MSGDVGQSVEMDRRVHGTGGAVGHAWEIVRYERAGKWVIEHTDCGSRRYVSLEVAVRSCDSPRLGVPGGSRFDAKIRARVHSPGQRAGS